MSSQNYSSLHLDANLSRNFPFGGCHLRINRTIIFKSLFCQFTKRKQHGSLWSPITPKENHNRVLRYSAWYSKTLYIIYGMHANSFQKLLTLSEALMNYPVSEAVSGGWSVVSCSSSRHNANFLSFVLMFSHLLNVLNFVISAVYLFAFV